MAHGAGRHTSSAACTPFAPPRISLDDGGANTSGRTSRRSYWRVFETKDDYFDYYRGYHAFWKLYGIDLPDAVLKKVYFQNALSITKGIPQAGWPK